MSRLADLLRKFEGAPPATPATPATFSAPSSNSSESSNGASPKFENLADALESLCAAQVGRDLMDIGITPVEWGSPVTRICEGCGPVLLWADCPAVVKACPWCFRRKAGKPYAKGCTYCGGLRGCPRCRKHRENLPSLVGLVKMENPR